MSSLQVILLFGALMSVIALVGSLVLVLAGGNFPYIVDYLEIIHHARQQEIDLIVMGTHGRTGLAHVFVGSVAERVIRNSPCPVLTVRPQAFAFEIP